MKAIRMHAVGGPEALGLDEIPIPQPQDEEVVVKVHAASVNPIDLKMRSGKTGLKQDQLPMVLGRDISGTVEICGTHAQLKKGDPVYAMLGGRERGGYAEYALVKAVEGAAKPGSLDHVHAAAVPLAALTAWQGLFDHGGLKPGQRVLIHGGAGGVGHFAVQFAKAKGAFVATTVSVADIDFVQKLHADQVVDYKAERFEDVVRDIDLVLDLIGGETQERSWAVLKDGGTIVSTLAQPSEQRARERHARGINYMARPNAAQLSEIGRLIDAGKVCPMVQATFSLSDAAAAQTKLEREHVQGKIVLDLAA
jgi:NADPH:quinone reductase-like Zn-dependent oxidoreductase